MELELIKPWCQALEGETNKPYFAELMRFLETEYATQTIYPRRQNIFRALNLCPPHLVRVVILGQDPYHGANQANGLCFSVSEGVRFPPSLVNIFKEIERDLAIAPPATGDLERWARQGVLMLNSVLTVEAGRAASHAGHGWEQFTDAIIRSVAEANSGVAFMLWGTYAQRKGRFIDRRQHCVLESVHPSPRSAYRGFIRCSHFSKINQYLVSQGKLPINW